MTKEGKVVPLAFEWDNLWYEISKVVETKKLASTKGGGKGTRYSCKIGSNIHYLFLDGYVWWVEIS